MFPTTEAEEDSALLRATVDDALHGDPDAWERLYTRLRPRLFALSLQRLRDQHDAEDAVAETMLRAVNAAGGFRWRGGGFDAWIFRICTNVIADMGRARARSQARLVGVQTADGAGADGAGADEGLVLADEHDAVRRAFDRLDDDEREVLELRLIAGLSSEEAAHVLGRRPGAVRMAQSRALTRLRANLAEESR
jgi:RNA polymerase sigma-70 factor, ECF subfamily